MKTNSWVEEENYLEATEKWCESFHALRKLTQELPFEVEPCVRLIYITHKMLVENDCGGCGLGHNYLTNLLLEYFKDSCRKFSDEAEFLFFVGIIMHIAEWFFGQNDDKLALQMQKKAATMEPTNLLYRFCYLYSKLDNPTELRPLAEEILDDKDYVEWAKKKGYPGRYAIGLVRSTVGLSW